MKHIRLTYVLSGFVFLGFAIELLGMNLLDKDLHSILKPVPWSLVYLGAWGLINSALAPFAGIAGMFKAFSDAREASSFAERKLIFTIAIVALPISFFEGVATMGHPIWYQGFNR